MPNTIKLLHIEDDYTDADLMQNLIRLGAGSRKIDTIHVDNLKDGLNKISDEQFDAVLLDLNLRDLSGPDNVRIINEHAPELPIIVLSGDSDDKNVIEAISLGAQDYIIKGHCDGTSMTMAIQSSIQRKAQERHLFLQANYDDLTGLPNKRLTLSMLQKRFERAKLKGEELALIYCGIDKMRHINKNLGIETGNYVLQEVSLRMRQILADDDFLGRYRSDEFIILSSASKGNLLELAHHKTSKIIHAMSHPYKFADEDYYFTVSSGISKTDHASADHRVLIHQAMSAMYEAKKLGGGKTCIYEPSIMAA